MTQSISSSVAPRFPIIAGSAVLTMLVSMISSSTASITEKTIRSRRGSIRSGAGAGADIARVSSGDAPPRREAHRERLVGRRLGRVRGTALRDDRVEHDLHRHALH